MGYKIHFWRTSFGAEVDFVICGVHGLHAFEIKHSTQVSFKSLKGLKSFKEEYPEAKLYLLYLGKNKEYHEDIEVIPFEEALKNLPTLIGKSLDS